jgi:Family of unknown function (DUF6051)
MTLTHPSYQKITQAIRRTEVWDDAVPLVFPEEGAAVYNLSFTSNQAHHLLGNASYSCAEHGLHFEGEPASDGTADSDIRENLSFRYPFLRAQGPGKGKHVIVLLHGLNERSYAKYVPWAFQLWRNTGAAVALFPLSFHINRVSPGWGRSLEAHLGRRREVAGNENVHPFNCVLSERLELRPERFFWGGVQSYHEVVDLVRGIREGKHPHLQPDAQVDLLGYSAGGYLAMGLMLGDEGGLFERSRCVVFESGASMRSTHLSTRFIMDLACEVALMKLFVRFTPRMANPRLAHWLADHEEGRWFRALFGEERERLRFEARLKELAPRLMAIANTTDEVIPSGAIFNTLRGKHRDTGVRVEELTLGVHEHPFVCPDYEQKDRRFVTESLDVEVLGQAFEQFIEAACSMLGR